MHSESDLANSDLVWTWTSVVNKVQFLTTPITFLTKLTCPQCFCHVWLSDCPRRGVPGWAPNTPCFPNSAADSFCSSFGCCFLWVTALLPLKPAHRGEWVAFDFFHSLLTALLFSTRRTQIVNLTSRHPLKPIISWVACWKILQLNTYQSPTMAHYDHFLSYKLGIFHLLIINIASPGKMSTETWYQGWRTF